MKRGFPALFFILLLLIIQSSLQEKNAAFASGTTDVSIVYHSTGGVNSKVFDPASITITAGDSVRFTNKLTAYHTATSGNGATRTPDGIFDTLAIAPGGNATVTLFAPGTITYYCKFHPYMTGSITVLSNGLPLADAGSDQTAEEGATVSLDGSSSSDPENGPLSYSWIQTVGPSVTLTDANTATPSFIAPDVSSDSTLTFQLTVTDGVGGTDTDTVSVTVQNIQYHTILTVDKVSSVKWGQNIMVTGKLTNDDGVTGISGKTISFTGTGAESIGAAVTDINGAFSTSGTAPNSVGSGWTVQAHYAGDESYLSSDSGTKTYSTQKHAVKLNLRISPTNTGSGEPYRVIASLTDTTTGMAIPSKTISFTADSPIVIDSVTTNASGKATRSGLVSPVAGTYYIQAHFAGTTLFNAKDSSMKTLTVS